MATTTAIHVARAGAVTAAVYKEDTLQTRYCVVLAGGQGAQVVLTEDELGQVLSALRDAEYFIRFEQQMAQMLRCPGCGDG